MSNPTTEVSVAVNGGDTSATVEPRTLLAHYLRDDQGLTGTHIGCDTSNCGACTVLIDGEAYLSCVMLAVDAVGKQVMTIEGLSEVGDLHPLQSAFVDLGALQCGFCTPGMILTAKAILDEEKHPTEEVIKQKMAGNLCRCTGYKKVVEAIMHVAEESDQEG